MHNAGSGNFVGKRIHLGLQNLQIAIYLLHELIQWVNNYVMARKRFLHYWKYWYFIPNKLLNKRPSCWWFEMPWRTGDVTIMQLSCIVANVYSHKIEITTCIHLWLLWSIGHKAIPNRLFAAKSPDIDKFYHDMGHQQKDILYWYVWHVSMPLIQYDATLSGGDLIQLIQVISICVFIYDVQPQGLSYLISYGTTVEMLRISRIWYEKPKCVFEGWGRDKLKKKTENGFY